MLVLFSLLFSTTSFAAEPPQPAQYTYKCDASRFDPQPAMNSDKQLEAHLQTQCELALKAPGSIAALNQSVIAQLPKQHQVQSGPSSENFENLPSQVYDVITQDSSSGDAVTIRQFIHVATDGKSQFILVTDSTNIKGKGNAAYLKYLKSRTHVTKDSTQDNLYHLTLDQTVKLAKPWYAPEGIFVSQASEALKKTFDQGLETANESLARELAPASTQE